jgi:CRISPR-associated protein Cas1
MKKTLCFGSPTYLRAGLKQLEIEQPAQGTQPAKKTTVPFEDIGVVIFEHPQITISHAALSTLMAHNAAVITCSEKYMPNGLFLCLDGNTLQSRRFQVQIDASVPLKKQLWAQTIQQKIRNQARVLNRQGIDANPLLRWSLDVRSGDPDNVEAKAAAWYWPRLFTGEAFSDLDVFNEEDPDDFIRDRYGDWPNSLLNYGYAILRAVVARALIGAGLLPTFGIHHRNQYNAYCLADDIMEPFRPSVDQLVCQIIRNNPEPPVNKDGFTGLTPALKRELLMIPVMDVLLENKTSPLQEAARRTAASLVNCFAGTERRILYPETL